MQKTLFCVVLLCLFLTPFRGVCQDDYSDETFMVGAAAGGNFGQFSQPGMILSGNAGGFMRLSLLPFLQIQAGISYDVFGGGRRDLNRDLSLFTDNSEVFNLDGPISQLHYINRHVYIQSAKIPVSARFGLADLQDTAIQPRFIVGGSFAYVISASETRDTYFYFEDNTRVILSDNKEDVSGDYKKQNISAHAGFEIDFKLDNGRVFTWGLIYNQGLTDLNNIKFGQPENIEKLRSRYMSVNFSYTFL